jgi:PAS domain S-box-containing protein
VTESDFQTFEAVGALVVVLDVDDRIVYWNQACSDLTCYALEEVRSRRFWDFLLVPEEVVPVRSALAAARTGDRPSRVANYWVTKAGERRWIAWSNTTTAGSDGRPRYCIKTGIDRSESKQAEDRLARIIGIAADAIISIDDEQRIVMYNQGAETIFGWSAAEAMGKSLDILIPERFRHVHGQHVRGFASGEKTARRMGERMPAIFGVRKNGEEFPAQAAISKLDVGGSRLFTVVLRDVSEERRRDKERELLADLGAALADTLDCDDMLTRVAGVVVRELADFSIVDVIDRDRRLRRKKVLHRDPGKKALCEMFRRLPVDARCARVVSAVVESKQPCLMAEVSPQYIESIAQDDEHLRALRELAPRSLIVVPLLARGEHLGVLVLVSSQPSRRYGDEDLRLAEEIARRTAIAIDNARLYDDAWAATHDLREANQQLVGATIQAQEATEEAEAARARAEQSERDLREVAEFREMFIGILGHDLRNPLASIAMSAASLRRNRHLDEQDEKRVARITSSSERMLRMISQMLDLTRARLGGGFPLEPKPTDLRNVCRRVVEEFEEHIRLEVQGDVTGTWDPDRLAEALSNIAGNAIEHAALGTAVVVKAHGEGPEVVVEIINQGDPIPADVLPFIFEPFRRAKQHAKSRAGNLGLGLYIANQIVHSGHGSLAAYSVDGTTTFLMRLPRHPPGAPRTEDGDASGPDRRDGASDRRVANRRHPG